MPSLPPPTPPTQHPPRPAHSEGPRSHWLLAGIMAAVASLVAACKSPPESPQADAHGLGADQSADVATSAPSSAATPLEYRKDAAAHLYSLNAKRIYQGKLPPALPLVCCKSIWTAVAASPACSGCARRSTPQKLSLKLSAPCAPQRRFRCRRA